MQGSPNRKHERSKDEMAHILMPFTHHCDESRDEERYWRVKQHHHTTKEVIPPGDRNKQDRNEPEVEHGQAKVERRYSPMSLVHPV